MSPAIVDRLPNGFTTAVVELPDRHQVLVTLFVRVGGCYEPPRQCGVSHFLEHVLFRGSEAYPGVRNLMAAFEAAGTIPNACTGVEATEFYFSAHPERLGEGLAALADMVRAPLFADIEREREIILEEILYDYNERGDLIHLGALAGEMIWPGHGLGQSVSGTPESLPRLDEAALRAHHAQHYIPDNLVLGLAGRVSAEQGFALAREAFGGWRNGRAPMEVQPEPPLPITGPHIRLVPDTDNQFHLQLSFPAPGYNSPEELALIMLVRILDDGPNSRLQREVRELRGLAYHVGADYTAYRQAGQIDITTSVKAERLAELLEVLLNCLGNFREQGPEEEELQAARYRHGLELEFQRDSLDAHMERQVWPLLYAEPREVEAELALVNAIDPSTIAGLTRDIFARNRLHLVLVGPVDKKAERIVARALAKY